MVRSRTGRRAHEGNIRSIAKPRAEPRKLKLIPDEHRANIESAYRTQMQAMQSLKEQWHSFLTGVRMMLGVPNDWTLIQDGDHLCFAEPQASPLPSFPPQVPAAAEPPPEAAPVAAAGA